MKKILLSLHFISFFILLIGLTNGQTAKNDTINIENNSLLKQEIFYDSLKYKASKRKFTHMIYDALISPPRPYVDKEALAINYYSQMKGKIFQK